MNKMNKGINVDVLKDFSRTSQEIKKSEKAGKEISELMEEYEKKYNEILERNKVVRVFEEKYRSDSDFPVVEWMNFVVPDDFTKRVALFDSVKALYKLPISKKDFNEQLNIAISDLGGLSNVNPMGLSILDFKNLRLIKKSSSVEDLLTGHRKIVIQDEGEIQFRDNPDAWDGSYRFYSGGIHFNENGEFEGVYYFNEFYNLKDLEYYSEEHSTTRTELYFRVHLLKVVNEMLSSGSLEIKKEP